MALEKLKKEVENCNKCALAKTRNKVVFGEGNPDALIVFVGEAPGEEEDLQGRPFVGRAGELLTNAIESANVLGIKRSDVYICNVVKCRPPNNRDPLPKEIASCQIYLSAQLKIIKPQIICALGKFAAQTLLQTKEKISSLRGKFYTYQGIKLLPTYHPALLLYNPAYKKEFLEDMLLLRKALYEN